MFTVKNTLKPKKDAKQLKEILTDVIDTTERRRTKRIITVSRLHKVNNGSKLKAFADITINDQVLVKGVRVIISKSNVLFVSMPQRKAKDGKWYNIVKLIDDEAKQEAQAVVLEAYNK